MSFMEKIAKAVRPRFHDNFSSIFDVDVSDDAEAVVDLAIEEPQRLVTLAGLSVIIEYEDGKRRRTQRSITCRSLHIADAKQYVHAFCHHRQALRSFRLDRIVDVFDALSGESLSPVSAFFNQFSPDQVRKSSLSWGLSVARRADLISLVNALVFVARCDKEFHPAERDVLEHAITRFWLEFDITKDCPADEILRYSDRLAPDGEMFWLAMNRIKEDPVLTRVFQRAVKRLIEADGIIRAEETYWAIEIDDFLRDTS